MAKKEQDAKKDLIAELTGLMEEIDEEGLRFLIEQADTIIYNMKVDEVNKAADRLNAARSGKKPGGKPAGASKSDTAAGKGDKEEQLVWVEEGSKGKSMFLVINNQRKIMDQESEMYPLVKIAHSTADPKEGTERLYRWFHRERDDVIFDAVLTPEHPAMEQLYSYLREHFSLKQK